MRKRNEDLDAELRSHLDMAKSDRVERGVSADDAMAAARREFGNTELVKQTVRDVWGRRWSTDFLEDLRYAVRMLRKNPWFSSVAVLTIALGIGVNAAIFGLVDAVLLNAVPFPEPPKLVYVWTTDNSGEVHSPVVNEYSAVSEFSQSFSSVAATGWVNTYYEAGPPGWQQLPGLAVSANFLGTLGVRPLFGRDFRPEEQAAGRDDVVLLTYGGWNRLFGGDPEIVGKQIMLDRRAMTVIGVLPPFFGWFAEYSRVLTITPLILDHYETAAAVKVAGTPRLHIVARLRPGVRLEQARQELQVIGEGLHGARNPSDRGGQLRIEDFAAAAKNVGPTRRNERRGLLLMSVAAGMVLLVACANVAVLLLARGVKRQQEIAIRSAIGCSRARMVRQLLTENLVLFASGGLAGLLAATWSEQIMARVSAGLISGAGYAQISTRVLLAGSAAAILCALVFGLIPAVQTTRTTQEGLKRNTGRATVAVTLQNSCRAGLVFQAALGMLLLVGLGLLLHSLKRVESAPLGFEPANLLTVAVTLPSAHDSASSRRAQLMNAALEQLNVTPEFESAGATDYLPMDGADSDLLTIERPSNRKAFEEEVWFVSASPHYFSTLQVPMVAGRCFDERDIAGAAQVAIVNQTFARTYFPGTSPIGSHVAFGHPPSAAREIVGVVADFRQRNPEEDLRPLVYLPLAQTLPDRWSVVLRKSRVATVWEARQAIETALHLADPRAYWQFGTMEEQIHDSESLTIRRPIITLLALFAGLALMVIVVGVLGTVSYSVAERTREIGIRVALGAETRQVRCLVMRGPIGAAAWGIGLGALGAFASARLLPTGPIGWSGSGIFLYGITRTDPLTYVSSAVLLIAVVVAAALVPTRRALRVDPVAALKQE